MLAFRAMNDPGRVAFFFEERPYTWEWLWSQSLAIAGMLWDCEVVKGDRVVLAIPNSPEFFPAFYGCLLAGAVAVPVYPGSGPERMQQYRELCDASLQLRPEDLPRQAIHAYPETSFPRPSPSDLAFIQYTSGSTSDPKGVQLTHANLLTNIRQMIAGMQITAEDVFVSWLPVYHDMGLILMTMAPFYLGAKIVLLPTSLLQVHQWLKAIGTHGGTFTAAPDIAYRLAIKWASRGQSADLSSLRVALNAAEPVRLSTIQAFGRTFGLSSVMTAGYGLAEATVGVCMSAPGKDPITDAQGHVSVGHPFPGIDISILKDNAPAEPGETGEILVKSPANTAGYFKNPGANLALHWQKGYIRTGDVGYLDSKGNLFVLGREKQVIKTGGRTLYAADLEESLETLPGIRQAAAIGMDDGQLILFAETRWRHLPGREEGKDLIISIVGRMHDHFGIRPARVYLLRSKAIPMTHNGKKQHVTLKKMYETGALRAENKILFPLY